MRLTGIAKRYWPYIEHVDTEGVEDGEVFVTLRGMAFHDANSADPTHCKAGTRRALRTALKLAAPCACRECVA